MLYNIFNTFSYKNIWRRENNPLILALEVVKLLKIV